MSDNDLRDDEGLWVRSEVMPDGSYGVAVNVGADTSWSLNRPQAISYATTCYERATEAEHDAAVFRLFTEKLNMPERAVAQMLVKEIRPDRPTDHTATKPLEFTVAIGRQGPFIKMALDGKEAGEMTTSDLRDHAAGVLNTLSAADLDANLYRVLSKTVGLDDNLARTVVGDLQNYWP